MWKKKRICKKIHREERLFNLLNYSWDSTTIFNYIFIFYIFFIALALTFKSFIAVGIMLLIGFLITYYLRRNYKAMPGKISVLEKAYDEAIKQAALKALSLEGCKQTEAFLLPTKTTKIPSAFNKKVRYTIRKEVKVVCLAENHFSVFTSCVAFDLLNPARFDFKKECAKKAYGCGTSEEYYYSFIRGVHVEAGKGARIGFISGEPSFLDIDCEKLAVVASAKPLVEALRKRLRMIQLHKQPHDLTNALDNIATTIGSTRTTEDKEKNKTEENTEK